MPLAVHQTKLGVVLCCLEACKKKGPPTWPELGLVTMASLVLAVLETCFMDYLTFILREQGFWFFFGPAAILTVLV